MERLLRPGLGGTCGAQQSRSEALLLGLGGAAWVAGVYLTALAGGSLAFAVVGPGAMLAAFWLDVRGESRRAARRGYDPDPFAHVAITLPNYAVFPALPVVMAVGGGGLPHGATASIATLLGAVSLVEGALASSPIGGRVVVQLARRPLPTERRAVTRLVVVLALLAGGATAVIASAVGRSFAGVTIALGSFVIAKAVAVLAAR